MVSYERERAVVTITIDRQQRQNAIDHDTAAALNEAWEGRGGEGIPEQDGADAGSSRTDETDRDPGDQA